MFISLLQNHGFRQNLSHSKVIEFSAFLKPNVPNLHFRTEFLWFSLRINTKLWTPLLPIKPYFHLDTISIQVSYITTFPYLLLRKETDFFFVILIYKKKKKREKLHSFRRQSFFLLFHSKTNCIIFLSWLLLIPLHNYTYILVMKNCICTWLLCKLW